MYQVLIIIHVLVAIAIIGFVLIQQGRGADAGAAFGSGASGTVFGARGSASFLSRATAVLAVLFFVSSLLLAYVTTDTKDATGDMMDIFAPAQSEKVDLPPVADDVQKGEKSGDMPSVEESKKK